MRKIVIGMLVGITLVFTYCIIIWKAYDEIQLMGPKIMRRRKYVKVKPQGYNKL